MAGNYPLDEQDRLRLLALRSKQEALEVFIGGGNAEGDQSVLSRYERCLTEINELKRELLDKAGVLDDDDMMDFTYFFDAVSGHIWYEDAE
jgi:hypothetical protein